MMSKKQKREIECLRYFARDNISYIGVSSLYKITSAKIAEDPHAVSAEEAYFQITDSGAQSVETTDKGRLLMLLDAKKWRLRSMDMYEQGVLEGSTPYYTLLGLEDERVPLSVADFMARTMFKGRDKDLIMSVYDQSN